MTANHGTTPNTSTDQTYDAAELALIADVKRLNQVHQIVDWGLLGNGTRYLLCSCDRKPRADGIFWDHILAALKKERGPVEKK